MVKYRIHRSNITTYINRNTALFYPFFMEKWGHLLDVYGSKLRFYQEVWERKEEFFFVSKIYFATRFMFEYKNHSVTMDMALEPSLHVTRNAIYLYCPLFTGVFKMYWSQPPLFPLKLLNTYLGLWCDYRNASTAITLYNKYFICKYDSVFSILEVKSNEYQTPTNLFQ